MDIECKAGKHFNNYVPLASPVNQFVFDLINLELLIKSGAGRLLFQRQISG
jgi:hypothetical protein